jgi:predicted anti-sigma-YlaC factor YlaD
MTDCADIRDLFGPVLEGDASPEETERVHSHAADCPECAELYDAMALVVGAGGLLDDLAPPPQLSSELASSPCRRWLGLLFQAVDREITQHNLERLLSHLEACESCRQVWHDLTLIHQVGDAMTPPAHLRDACIRARDAIRRISVLPRRTATAAAYVLALLASLAIGNPTIIAQDLQATATQHVSWAASEVSEVAEEGRGEARVLLWRAMRWGEARIDAVRGVIDRLTDDDTTQSADTGDAGDTTTEGEQP